jgi:isopentenyldiphosphate isomerase
MTNYNQEILEVVDREGTVVGLARRSELHGNPSLTHRVVHVLVFNHEGELLLQKRSLAKDVAPGKWDTSVGGHVSPGEDVPDAAKREMTEELGISDVKLDFLYTHLFSDHTESELVSSFSCVYNGEINFDPEEIEEVAFWDFGRIRENLGKDLFSKHFEEEIATYVRLKGPVSG